jgi:ketosteroid isomerase-like protein
MGAAPVGQSPRMDVENVERFTQRWLEAWNSHDLEAIVSHFTDDVVFTSPLAVEMVDWSDGVVRGKAALREY